MVVHRIIKSESIEILMVHYYYSMEIDLYTSSGGECGAVTGFVNFPLYISASASVQIRAAKVFIITLLL